MDIFTWDEMLATGNETIDAQHKQLIEALNNIIVAYNEGKGEAEVMRTINFMAHYTIRHFADEEALQIQYNYPDYHRHRLYHDEFRKTIHNMLEEINKQGPDKYPVRDLIKTMSDWLINHIKGDDFKLAAHIYGKNN